MKRKYLLFLGAAFIIGGCSSVLDSAISSAGKTVGEAAGRMAGERIVRTYSPRFTSMYASYMFTYAFTPGGYWVEPNEYETGQWTKWRFVEDGEPTGSWLERAFLKRNEEGQEWWRVTMYDVDSDDTVTLEALFAADKSTVLRLRSKFPDQEISEMPVQEGTMIYREPMELTDESLEGATVETGSVEVPAGSFTARHIRYGDMASGGTLDWWITDEVPGGVAKYGSTSQRSEEEEGVEGLDEYNYTLELTEYGSGATTELNSF
ncbi:MAG: hypothetical protein R6W82_05410 [bacterium]